MSKMRRHTPPPNSEDEPNSLLFVFSVGGPLYGRSSSGGSGECC